MKKTEIECMHVKLPEYRHKSIYIYELPDKQTIYLCPDCNMNLAAGIMKQIAVEVFVDRPEWIDDELIEREEYKKCKKKIKIKQKKK